MRAKPFLVRSKAKSAETRFKLTENSSQLVCTFGYACPNNSGVTHVWKSAQPFNLHVKRGKLGLFHFLKDSFNHFRCNVSEEPHRHVDVLCFHRFQVSARLNQKFLDG